MRSNKTNTHTKRKKQAISNAKNTRQTIRWTRSLHSNSNDGYRTKQLIHSVRESIPRHESSWMIVQLSVQYARVCIRVHSSESSTNEINLTPGCHSDLNVCLSINLSVCLLTYNCECRSCVASRVGHKHTQSHKHILPRRIITSRALIIDQHITILEHPRKSSGQKDYIITASHKWKTQTKYNQTNQV